MKIQDIIDKFYDKYKDVYYNDEYQEVINDIKQFLQNNLTLMLEDIEKEMRTEDNIRGDIMPDIWDAGYLSCRQEVINIINSHR